MHGKLFRFRFAEQLRKRNMKIIIEDVVARMEGKEETELPLKTSIRFEIGTTQFSVKGTEDGLEIYKIESDGRKDGRVIMICPSSNKVVVS